jgi:hypothetical protein
MKQLKGWDAYVADTADPERDILELPLTEDEVYLIRYPTRAQGKAIAAAQARGDVDALLIALLGEDAGRRVVELSDDQPGYVLDAFVLDVLRSFGFAAEVEKAIEGEVEEGKSRRSRTRGGRARTSSAA